jgi:hypothetical protein
VCVDQLPMFCCLHLAIECSPPPTDTSTSTKLAAEGISLGDIATYKCKLGYQTVDTGAIQYNITCIRTPHTVIATWSAHPDTAGK